MKVSEFISKIEGKENPREMPKHFFFGVRHMDYNTAQRADISKQHYTVVPRHWYVDATFSCHDCGTDFIFTANEQRFWYEERRFFIDSLPKHCLRCRKAERTRLDLRKRYDALVSQALRQCPKQTKQEVVDIINELEMTGGEISEKMVATRSRLYAQLSKTV
jgi:hypothetical protein